MLGKEQKASPPPALFRQPGRTSPHLSPFEARCPGQVLSQARPAKGNQKGDWILNKEKDRGIEKERDRSLDIKRRWEYVRPGCRKNTLPARKSKLCRQPQRANVPQSSDRRKGRKREKDIEAGQKVRGGELKGRNWKKRVDPPDGWLIHQNRI